MVLKKPCLALLSLVCLMLAPSPAAHAQNGRILKYSLDTAPKNILVTRGTSIEFNGPVNRAGEQNYYLQCNGQVLDSGTFRDQWALRFDTRGGRTTYTTATLHIGTPGGANVLLARLHIFVAEDVPFKLSRTATDLKPVDVVTLRLDTSNRQPQKVELTLDAHPLKAELDAKGMIRFDPADEQIGVHSIGGRVVTDDEQTYDMEPIKVGIVGKVRLFPFPFGDTLDLATINGSIPLRAQTAPGVQVASILYKMDGAALVERREAPFQSAVWNPRRVAPGPHKLQAEVLDKDGKRIVSAVYPFQVVIGSKKKPSQDTEAGKDALPANSNAAIAAKLPVRLVVPTDAKQLLQPAILSVQCDAGVKIKSVTYTVGGNLLQTDPVDPLTAFWDVRSEWPGAYDVEAVVTTEDGHTYRPAVTVRVPVRVSVLPIANKIEVSENTKTLPLRAGFLDGLVLKSVTFEIDGRQVAVCEKAPFEAATIDISDLDTGAHRLVVRVDEGSGANYVSPVVTFDVINKPQEIARKKELDAIKAEIEERKHIAEYLRRKSIVGQALGSSKRSGIIGTVNGLSVLTVNGEPIIGRLFTVEGAVALGSGKVTLIPSAEEDTQEAATIAAENCKSKILQIGYSVNWTMMDLTLSYPGAGRVAGDSAGVANTIALISACLKKPVDSSVAMTGAISLNGEVKPVGGVDFKAAGALSNPNIHTIIIPADYVNKKDIDRLYVEAPELFINKRVILVSNVEEVLRQAIIGYDKKFDQAEDLVQQGIRAFLDGKDSEALSAFNRAARLTPENATISAWIAAVQSNKK